MYKKGSMGQLLSSPTLRFFRESHYFRLFSVSVCVCVCVPFLPRFFFSVIRHFKFVFFSCLKRITESDLEIIR
jgi:hypothetical protein